MSKILFCALGGIEEFGKNLYCLDIDGDIFVLDCGLKYPTSELKGIDIVINDTTYLLENRDRIKGLFLSNARDENIGGTSFLLRDIPELKVFGSAYTLAVLKDTFEEDKFEYNEENFIVVTPKSKLEFGPTTVRFFEVSHTLPMSLGIDFKTEDGNIVYTSNYNFDQNSKIDYGHMFRALSAFSKEGTLALFSESSGATNDQSRGTILEFKVRIQNLMSLATHRMIFSVFSSDILRIRQICNIAHEYGKRVAMTGIKRQKLISEALKMGFLDLDEGKIEQLNFAAKENNYNNDDNLVVIVVGKRHEPYYALQRMSNQNDRLIHLTPTDTVVVLTPPALGTEKMAAKTLDIVFHTTTHVIQFADSLVQTASANREEIKQIINLLKPRYLVPIMGEYRFQKAFVEIAHCIGYDEKRVLLIGNGDQISFENGKYKGFAEDVKYDNILIDGKAIENVDDTVMYDRNKLSDDGLVIITCNINPHTKTIISGPEITTRGFSVGNNPEEFLLEMKKAFFLSANKFLIDKYINWSGFKDTIKKELSYLIHKNLNRNPLIVPVLISTDLELIKNKRLS